MGNDEIPVGEKKGLNPTDLGKSGVKGSLLTEGHGVSIGVAIDRFSRCRVIRREEQKSMTNRRLKGSIILGILTLIVLSGYGFSVHLLSSRRGPSQMNLSLPPQGLYESCSPMMGSRCLDRLKKMAAAGFKLVLNYEQLYGTADQQLAYAKQAHSLGMKVIWAMNDPAFWNGTDLLSHYQELAATCKCSDNRGFIHYVVNLVKDLPATWGYYVGDEVDPANHAKVKPFSDLVHQLDPLHPRLYVAVGSPDGSQLTPFADIADVIGMDCYPIGTPGGQLSEVGHVASIAQSIADQNKKQSVMVLQAFSWGEYPEESWICSPFPECTIYPTESEMRQMLDLTLQNSRPPFILWYSYFDILRSDNPALRWSNLVAAASGS